MLVFVLIPWVLILEHRKQPELNQVELSRHGIRFGKMAVPYTHIKSFWILHNPLLVDELHVLTESKTHPEWVIQIMGVSSLEVRHFLVTQVQESEGKHLSFLDVLIRILRLN
jgi:hypothetical protein